MAFLRSIRDLYSEFAPYRSSLLLVLALLVVSGMIDLTVPFLAKTIVDQGIFKMDLQYINLVLISLLMFFIGTTTSEFLRNLLMRHVGLRVNFKLNYYFILHVLRQNALSIKKEGMGKLLQHINDNIKVDQHLTTETLMFISAAFRLLLYGLILLVFNSLIFLIYVISLTLNVIWDFYFVRQSQKNDDKRFEVSTVLKGQLLDIVQGFEDIKVNNLTGNFLKKWKGVQEKLSYIRLEYLKLFHYYTGGTLSMIYLKDIFIIFYTAKFVITGTMTLGEMVAVQYILGAMNKPIQDVTKFIEQSLVVNLSLKRMEIIKHGDVPPVSSWNGSSRRDIAVRNLSYSYGETSVLNNISFSMPFGTITSVIGESGSGKTTLLKLLSLIIQPRDRSISVGNILLDESNESAWHSQCALVLQDGHIFSDSVRYNITLKDDEEADQVDKEQLQKVIEMSLLEDVINLLPRQLDTQLGSAARQLSAGQRQRILIARALYQNTNYLLMDEPTSSLDLETGRSIMENIAREYQDKTVFFISHHIHYAQLADQIILLRDGKIAEIGSYQGLVDRRGEFYKLLKS